MRKKILAMLLAAVMAVSLFPSAFAIPSTTPEETQTSISLERSEKDGADYFVSAPISLYEFWWGEYYEKEKISGYSVLSHETELTIVNNADADDEGYLNVWLNRFSIAKDGRYVSGGDTTYCTLTKSGRFLSQTLDYEEYDNAYENADFVELRPGESTTFSLSGYETQYDYLGNEYGKYDLLVVMAYFSNVSYSDSGPHVVRTWGEVHYAFVIDDEEAARMSQEQTGTSFTDVKPGQWYTDAVAWAVANNITNGTTATTFGPNDPCTRGQIVTFLWRAYGSQKPSTAVSPFTDVTDPNAYYYDAVLWAYEKGIVTGTSATVFGVNDPCTRAQAVTFQYRAAGSPAVTGGTSFTDVSAGQWYTNAVAWASANGIATGVSATVFGINDPCTRGHVVTFLYRELGA